jgi:hypothetical protein
MPAAPLDSDLSAFEAALDESLDAATIWRFPRHFVLSLILNRIRDLEFGGHDVAANPPRPKAAQSLMDRIPVLLPYLVRCPIDFGPAPFADEEGAQSSALEAMFGLAEVLSWAHAAELFPDLWRGWRKIAALSDLTEGTLLEHDEQHADHENRGEPPSKRVDAYSIVMASPSAADWEVRDIVLARLATPWGKRDSTIEADIASALDVPGIPVLAAVPLLAARFLKAITLEELELVDDEAMRRVVGVTNEEFDRFRNACVAVGVALSAAAEHCMSQSRRKPVSDGHDLPADRDQWFNDARVWALPTLPASDVVTWLEGLTGLDARKVNRLIGAFCEPHAAAGWSGRAGEPVDGFFPPFWEVSKNDVRYLLLSPWHLQTTVMRHSLLSRYARLEPTSFHELVSHALEPTLLRATVPIWERLDGVIVATNCHWSSNGQRGEIDILVFQQSTNTVVQIQAKASLVAISSRMVARMEDTVAKGVKQLNDVRSLPTNDREAVLTKALGVPVRDPHLVDVLMTTGGVGSAAAWSSLGHIVALNPVLLNAAIESVLADEDPALSAVAERATALLDGLVADAGPNWYEETVVLGLASDAGSTSVTFPALSLDQAKVARFRRLAWPTTADPSS